MDTEYVPFLLVTANVGSVFEDVSALLFLLYGALVAILNDYSVLHVSFIFFYDYDGDCCFVSNCLLSFDVGVLYES